MKIVYYVYYLFICFYHSSAIRIKMNENELIDAIQKLLDRRDGSLTVPRIERIKDVHQFMLEHYKGDMVDLRERMGAEAKQCRDIIKILQDEVGLKMNMIDKLRKDMRALIVEMQNPNVALRFLVNKEKIPSITWTSSIFMRPWIGTMKICPRCFSIPCSWPALWIIFGIWRPFPNSTYKVLSFTQALLFQRFPQNEK